MSEKPAFGFGAKLAAFQPAEALAPAAARGGEVGRQIDQVGEKLGFISREPLVRKKRRQGLEEATDQINIRAAISDINAFIEWCEANRYTSGMGFRELVKRIQE